MKCFIYSSGTPHAGLVLHGKETKTCAITLNIPCDWNWNTFEDILRARDTADVFLHGCTELTEGDSCSSIFPSDCVLVRCDDITAIHNVDNSCLELNLKHNSIDFILYSNSSLYDEVADQYIINQSGEIEIQSGGDRRGLQTIPSDSSDYEILL